MQILKIWELGRVAGSVLHRSKRPGTEEGMAKRGAASLFQVVFKVAVTK